MTALSSESDPHLSIARVLHRRKVRYWTELATDEKTLLALEPIKRIVPTTITKMTASITAYSAMSWPCSSRHKLTTLFLIDIVCPPSNQADGHKPHPFHKFVKHSSFAR